MPSSNSLEIHDLSPSTTDVTAMVQEGLTAQTKWLPTMLLYDERGSELFEEICDLDEYYLKRAELSIMHEYASDMAKALGARCRLIEYGSGSSDKTRLLLDTLEDIAAYVPVDISEDFLMKAAESIAQDYPDLTVLPTCADFTSRFAPPSVDPPSASSAVYFPGSTICNMDPATMQRLLEGVVDVTEGGSLLVGADVKKDIAVMEAAYNDREGVTAEFNLNMLDSIADTLDIRISRDDFVFKAEWNEDESAIVSKLYAKRSHTIGGPGWESQIAEGETIRTERSYKYSLDQFEKFLGLAGLERRNVWTDGDSRFSVQLFQAS